MLSVSLHGIRMTAPRGLYPQEHILNNTFETDVDVYMPDEQPWPYVDYTIIHEVTGQIFAQPDHLLETFAHNIHSELKKRFPESLMIRVAIRKINPPVQGQVGYAQVCYEK
jgi:dihydroneopterin aldolase